MVKINSELVARSAKDRQKRDETREKFVARQTHFMLQDKAIIDTSGLALIQSKACTSLYLYDNRIERLTGMANFHGLRDLYLQNNQLQELSGIEACTALERLFCENNQIAVLGGLAQCECLAELHLAGQRIPDNNPFGFEEMSLIALRRSLTLLDLSGCNVVDPSPLALLQGLLTINLSQNQIQDLEVFEEILPQLGRLEHLTLLGNPVCAISRMRQQILLSGHSLYVLDGKEVLASERNYLAHVAKRLGSQERSPSANMSSEHSLQVVHEVHHDGFEDEFQDEFIDQSDLQ